MICGNVDADLLHGILCAITMWQHVSIWPGTETTKTPTPALLDVTRYEPSICHWYLAQCQVMAKTGRKTGRKTSRKGQRRTPKPVLPVELPEPSDEASWYNHTHKVGRIMCFVTLAAYKL